MHRAPSFTLPILVALAAALALPSPVRAERRKSPLDGEPAVRHRLLLVKKRFEAAFAFEASVNADYRHTAAGGLKLEYHISDMWSLGALGFLGGSFNTGLSNRIIETLPSEDVAGDPTPTAQQFEEHLNSMPIHGAAYLGLTPWYGKLAAFEKFFVNFDFYFQAGAAFARLENGCCGFANVDNNPGVIVDGMLPDNDPNDDLALNDGTRLGVYLGGGIHLFLNDWLALDLTVRDYMFSDNPSGLDFDADLAVTDEDNRFLNHLFMGVGVSLFLPTEVKRTQ